MEEQIDRICCLSSAAAPKGKTFGERTEEVIDDAFQICYEQIETPPRKKKDVAVVTPNRLERSQEVIVTPDERKSEKRLREDENNMSSTYKERKSFADEQLNLIRLQLKSSEESVLAAEENANAAREISNAAKEIAICAKEMAISNKILASAAEKIANSAENSVKVIKEL
ncbi:uncharacterized protein LOC142221471 [Haematobia irritans]|uniref:uncharacterized protein LOC142221471 n=1 Tax=Haematobia irritans TaxID=7368 RepID=UPI003F5029BE